MHAYRAFQRMPAAANECWLSKAAVVIIPCADQAEVEAIGSQRTRLHIRSSDRKHAAIERIIVWIFFMMAVCVTRGAW